MKKFKTLKEAKNFVDENKNKGLRIFDRKKCRWLSRGQKNQIKNRFVVCTEIEWLNI
jgi:hypothetical protein